MSAKAGVTDDLIAVTAVKSGFSPMLVATDGGAFRRFARTILALQAPAQVQGEPVTVAVDHFDNGPFEAYTNRIYPSVEIGTKLYATPQPAHHGITTYTRKDMTEWQPIETAPKDGPFLAVLDCGGAQTICTTRYVVAANMNNRPSGEFIRDRVTHWRPLPALPESPYNIITTQTKKEDE